MYNFKLDFLILVLLGFHTVICDVSSKKICADEECKEPISLAKTTLRYSGPEPGVLSFPPNAEAKIFSKEVGPGEGYWEAEINGKRGYVPKRFIKEYKVINKNTITINTLLPLKDKVPLETSGNISDKPLDQPISTPTKEFKLNPPEKLSDLEEPEAGESQIDLTPDKVKEVYEIVDGTTIFSEPSSTINPSLTQVPVHATSVVPGNDESVNTSHFREKIHDSKDAASEDIITEDIRNVLANDVDSNKEEEYPMDVSSNEMNSDETDEKVDFVLHKTFSTISNYMNGDSEKIADEEKTQTPDIEEQSSTINEQKIYPQTLLSSELKNEVIENGDFHPIETATQLPVEKDEGSVDTSTFQDTSPPSEMHIVQGITETPFEEAEPLPMELTVTQDPSELSAEIPLDKLEPLPVEPVKPSLEMPIDPAEAPTSEPLLQSSDDETAGSSLSDDSIALAADSSTSSDDSQPATIDSGSQENTSINDITIDTVKTSTSESLLQSEEDKTKIVDSDIQSLSEKLQSSTTDARLSVDSIAVAANSSTQEHSEGGEYRSIEDVSENDSADASSIIYNFFKTAIEMGTASEEGSNDSELKAEEINPESNENQVTQDEVGLSAIDDAELSPQNSSSEVIAPETHNVQTEEPADNTGNSNPDDANYLGEETEEDSSVMDGVIEEVLSSDDTEEHTSSTPLSNVEQMILEDIISSSPPEKPQEYCENDTCETPLEASILHSSSFSFNYDLFLYLSTSAISCIIFLLMYSAMDKNNRLKPLIAKINQLEKDLMITLKENEELQERRVTEISDKENTVSGETYDLLNEKLAAMEVTKQVLEMEVLRLQQAEEGKRELEQQIELLEKELETSTEVGMELNRIISEMLDPKDGGDRLKENVEQLQRQLLEQKAIIEEGKNLLSVKEADILLLQSELEASQNKKTELLEKLEEMVDQISKIEMEREKEHKTLQEEVTVYQEKYNEGVIKNEMLTNDIQALKAQLTDSQRQAELRIKEYNILKDSLKTIKSMSNDPTVLRSLLDTTTMKAEFHQLKTDNENHLARLKQEQAAKTSYEEKCRKAMEDNQSLMKKFREAEKEKVEVNMKLEVLNNYFKKKEEELQGDILKYKSIWEAKEGEATSTTERIKLMQEEIENYKSQNEILKQEIISQEIDLKSQISMLEKKVHENWVNARQSERKLEDARQEAAQLRNRITLGERNHNRLQSPVDQNGELNMSTNSFDSPTSPLFGGRDRLTQSPPAMPPFLPPPPGVPFLPPPHGMPFMPPPPPGVFPGDRRPPPLGRLSSPPPPLNARYSPDSSAFSLYDRNSPSPPYDSEYGTTPPPMRRYSPYERDYQRMTPHVSNGRSKKGSMMSSGSDHSVESIEKLGRKQSKMV